jgi:hypothetical protein
VVVAVVVGASEKPPVDVGLAGSLAAVGAPPNIKGNVVAAGAGVGAVAVALLVDEKPPVDVGLAGSLAAGGAPPSVVAAGVAELGKVKTPDELASLAAGVAAPTPPK